MWSTKPCIASSQHEVDADMMIIRLDHHRQLLLRAHNIKTTMRLWLKYADQYCKVYSWLSIVLQRVREPFSRSSLLFLPLFGFIDCICSKQWKMDVPDDDNDHDYQNNHNHCHQLRCKLVTSRRWLKYVDQYCEVIMMVSIKGIIMVIMVTSWYCKLILIQATAAAQRIGRLFGLVRYNHNEHPDDDHVDRNQHY